MALWHLDLPTRSFLRLYHVGTMNPRDKQPNSLKGAGLSVSEVSESWRRITELGNAPVFRLKRAGNAFLDARKLTDRETRVIEDWGIHSGLIKRTKIYRVQYFDDEWGSTLYSEYTDKREAECEAEDYGVKVKTINGYIGTDGFMRVTRTTQIDPITTLPLLLTIYAETETLLDGVFWNDTLNESYYSAPKAVIMPSRVPAWTATKQKRSVITRE